VYCFANPCIHISKHPSRQYAKLCIVLLSLYADPSRHEAKLCIVLLSLYADPSGHETKLCIVLLSFYADPSGHETNLCIVLLSLYADSSRHQVQVQMTLMPRPAHTSFGRQILAPLPYQVYGHGQVPYNTCISYPPTFVPPPHAAPVYGHGLYNSISSPPVPVTVPASTPIRECGSEGFPPPLPHHDHQEEGLTRPQHYQAETRPSKGVALTPELTGLSLEKMIQFPVHYWFSPENLREDKFLKQNMDAEGWVPISHIITFPSVSILSNYCIILPYIYEINTGIGTNIYMHVDG